MDNARFAGSAAWLAAVDRAVARGGVRRTLAAEGVDEGTLLLVARVEAAHTAPDGVSTLSHERLAELSGVERSAVLRVRLALIELGLESLTAAPGTAGRPQRLLHHT